MIFVLQRSHFCTNLHEILAPELKLILQAPLFYEIFHFDQPHPRQQTPCFSPKTAKKKRLFLKEKKTDFCGLKDHLEVRVQHETCSTICTTPVPAILNHKNSPGLAGGTKNSPTWLYLYPILAVFDPSCQPGRIFMVQNGWCSCPAYSTTCFMLDPYLKGLFQAPKVSFFSSKKPFLAFFWLKQGGSLTRERLVKMK